MMRVWLMKLGEKLIHLPELLIIYFAPAGGQLFVVAMAVLCDTATGVWAARKAGEKISSRRLADIFPKRGRLNIDRAVKDFGYSPTVNVEEGFLKYYNWFQSSYFWQNKLGEV